MAGVTQLIHIHNKMTARPTGHSKPVDNKQKVSTKNIPTKTQGINNKNILLICPLHITDK
jgi:hypothetical protein